MTEPTDDELDAVIAEYRTRIYPQDMHPRFERAIMRAAIAKWGTPPPKWEPVAWNGLTDEDRERAMNSMPGMLEGFTKTWGWLHFAKAIENICREKNTQPAPASQEDAPAVVDVPDQCPYFGPSPHRDVWLEGWYARAALAPHGQPPAQAAPAYKDSTPELHVGDSAFESWYSAYNPAHKSDKQRAHDAYVAGMGDRQVTAAPAAVAGPSEFPHEQMDALALARYKVVPSHESMFHRHAVVAGDGSQQLYIGREVECENIARKFAGAFLDGAFAFHSMLAAAPTPPAQTADSVTAPAGGEIDCLRAALVYVAFALHGRPQYMLAEGITLIDGDTVRVSRDGWTVEASINPARATPPAQAADSVLEDAARESEYRRGYRHGYEQRDAEVRGALV